ncbi:hypothetical protein JX266_004082 [Neoarthrinium moseri]|uniref:uncharacterized protein n=1 Tax=Neoarthrinium moseri TaxID=1658444 RepID=UPI001FDC24D8|nr:uncharacterized protein JN550_001782 [Neoarthrinium moseri]KAI1850224.1 hypothetical protein JX266_004082 [Neoarthrinium moseri]KAI1876286.1 hypothetical protein JN550_001782 [Neoarthrinium moseri]
MDPWLKKAALSFDGGGIRGYWSLLALKALMEEVQKVEKERDEGTHSSFAPCAEPERVSHLRSEEYTHFLPCHYFDYIGGTSTGALITILLSRFRMTVEDCITEYRTMAGTIFGRRRVLHALNTFIYPKPKYYAKSLDDAINQVSNRRKERGSNKSEILFETDSKTCRGIALATDISNISNTRFLFRSYMPFSELGKPIDQTIGMKNHDEGIKLAMLTVARAATAAPLFFGRYRVSLTPDQVVGSRQDLRSRTTFVERLTTRQPEPNSMKTFEDAGFTSANNPSAEILDEIEYQQGAKKRGDRKSNRPIVVSIGTARPGYSNRKETVRSIIKKSFYNAGNTEDVHSIMLKYERDGKCLYHRFNDEYGLNIEMDEWKPSKDGRETLRRMDDVFQEWRENPGVRTSFRACAERLVDLRRARACHKLWKRYALVMKIASLGICNETMA